MGKLRIGRVIFAITVLALAYWFASSVRDDSKIISTISKEMTVLSAQLKAQQKQTERANQTLANFIGNLEQLNHNIYQIKQQLKTKNQTISHSLDNISNTLLNMKSKVDMIDKQNQRDYYR